MNTDICSARDILNINKTKEYTLTATCLLEALLTDTQLLAESSKLWLILFNRARFNEDLEVKISYKELASLLGKSLRSICRYIADLVQHHYLSIQNNYLQHDGQTINSIFVRFPKKMIAQVTQSKDRVSNRILNTATGPDDKPSIDKIDNDLPDNYGIANNSIEYNNKITNNKNTVVVFNEKKTEASLAEKQQHLLTLKQAMVDIQQQMSLETDHVKRFDLMRKFTEYDASINVEEHSITRLEKMLHSQQEQTIFHQEMSANVACINEQSGTRKLADFALKRLQHSLQKQGYSGPQLTLLTNEIVHEIRFGSLVLSSNTQQELPIDHAINIALKLVREKRWNTPTALVQKQA